MKDERSGIVGTGFYLPERVLTNADLEKMVETTDAWIVERTGIRERRIAAAGEAVSAMAEKASRSALAAAGVPPEELDLIIVGTFTPDRPLPASACLLGSQLGNRRAACFDLSAACCAFIYALEVADKLLRAGEYRTALVVAAEKISAVTDWKDRDTCVLFGDGAGAAVLKKGAERGAILGCYLGADGSKSSLLEIPAGGSAMPVTHEVLDQRLNFIRMEGREVFKLAVASMVDAAREVLKRTGHGVEEVAWLIPHQANLRIMTAVAKRLGIPEEKVHVNVDRYGNMSGATIPIALAEMNQAGRLRPGDLVLMVAFGGGLTWAATLIRW